MVDTRKFSQFIAAGDLANTDQTVGIDGGNAIFTNPWVFYAPGNTAARPISPIVGQLRFNTDLLEYEYWSGLIWDQLTTNGNSDTQWQNVTTASQAIIPGTAYLANNAGQVVFTLPTIANIGSEIKIAGVYGGGGWKIAQNASQYVVVDNVLTTIGPSGYLQSNLESQSISLVCIVPNIAWSAFSAIGCITQV